MDPGVEFSVKVDENLLEGCGIRWLLHESASNELFVDNLPHRHFEMIFGKFGLIIKIR